MVFDTTPHPRISRRRALTLVILPVGAVALLSACGGSAVGTATSAASAPAATSAASTASSPAATAATNTAATTTASSSAAATTTAAVSSALTSSAVSSAATSTAAAAAPASSAAAVPTGRPGALQVWMPNTSFSLTAGIGADLMKQFLPAHPNISLDAIVEGDLTKFKTQVAGGVPPDLFQTQSYVQTTWGATKVVQALDAYIARSKNIKLADIWKKKLAEVQWAGKTWALPYSIDNRVVFVNDDLYRRAGLDVAKPPATWADMETAVSKTTQVNGTQLNQTGWDPFGGSGGRLTFLVPFWQQGGDFAPGDGTKVDIANDMAVTALTWLLKIEDMQGGFNALAAFAKANSSDGTGEKVFAASHTAQIYATIANKVQTFQAVPNLTYHVAQYPLPPNGKVATYAGGWAFCVGTGAKHADDAMTLVDFFYQPDVQIKWAAAQLRVPPSQSVAQSVDYTQNDPLLKLTVDAMPNGSFVPSVPGGEQILPILNTMVADIMSKKTDVNAALENAQKLCQLEVDKYKA
jgi:multiple sugar transport system substrate-binding protein